MPGQQIFPSPYVVLSPRRVALGTGDGSSLQNVNTAPIADRAVCVVKENNALYLLRKEATDAPSGDAIIQPVAGPGRWFKNGTGGGAACVALSRTLFVDGLTTTPPASQDGSVCSPFSTIQAAIDATSGLGEAWEIVITPKPTAYAESLVFPVNRSIALVGAPGANLGVNVTGAHTVTAPGAGLTAIIWRDVFSTGGSTLTATTADPGALLALVFVASAFTGGLTPEIVAGGWAGGGSIVVERMESPNLTAPTMTLDIEHMALSGAALSVFSIESANDCRIGTPSITVAAPPGSTRGFVGCTFFAAVTFTSVAALSFVADETSNSSFLANGGTFGGAATRLPLGFYPPVLLATTFVPAAVPPGAETFTAMLADRVPYDPAPNIVGPPAQTIKAPPTPPGGSPNSRGHRWAIKNMTPSGTGILIDGNGNSIEDDTGTPVASFTYSTARGGLEWEWDGNAAAAVVGTGTWRLVSEVP